MHIDTKNGYISNTRPVAKSENASQWYLCKTDYNVQANAILLQTEYALRSKIIRHKV